MIGWYRTCRPAVSERLVCPGGASRRCSCAPPFKRRPGSPLGFSFFHDPDTELQRDKLAVNVRLIYYLSRRGMWIIPGFLCMHRVRLALSQVKPLSWLRPGSGIPSISTAYAQARRRCAQVIHMFVHRQQGGSPVAGLAGSSGSACRCLRAWPAGRMRGSGPGLDEIASGRQPPDGRRRPEGRPPAHTPPACRSRASRSAGTAADR